MPVGAHLPLQLKSLMLMNHSLMNLEIDRLENKEKNKEQSTNL